MKPASCLIVLIATLATACSSGGGDAPAAAAKGEALSVAECRQIFEKSMSLQGMPADTFAEIADQAAKDCHAAGKMTMADLRCAQAATSMDQLQACGIDTTP